MSRRVCTKFLSMFLTVFVCIAVSITAFFSIDVNEVHAEESKTVFAIFTQEDNTMRFYNREIVPSQGDVYDGHKVDFIFKDFLDTIYIDLNAGIELPPDVEIPAEDPDGPFVGGGVEPLWEHQWRMGLSGSIHVVEFVDEITGVHSTADWFVDCYNLESVIGADKLNMSEVTDMSRMFRNCSSLTTLDLSGWNTSNVKNTEEMFAYDFILETIIVSDTFNLDNVDTSENMFYYCQPLAGGQGTQYSDSVPTDKTYAHVDFGDKNPGYFTPATKIVYHNLDGSNISEVNYMYPAHLMKPAAGFIGWTSTQGDEYSQYGVGELVAYSADDPYATIDLYPATKQEVFVTFDANGGLFLNKPLFKQGQNQVKLLYEASDNPVYILHSQNLDDNGEGESDYGDDQNYTNSITVPDADRLKVTITYQTESTSYDWVCVYGGNVVPDEANYDESVSGKLGGSTQMTQVFYVDGNTAQIYFHSDSSVSNYYGYYATVEKYVESDADSLPIVEGEYMEPTCVGKKFIGWSLTNNPKYLPKTYNVSMVNPNEIVDLSLLNYYGTNITLYAQWEDPEEHTFAIYSEDDHSLNFYHRTCLYPEVGEVFDGRVVTEVYDDEFIYSIYGSSSAEVDDRDDYYYEPSTPWADYRWDITEVNIKDSGIAPRATQDWFCGFRNCVEFNGLEKLDMSGCTSMAGMFQKCQSVESLVGIEDWDTSKVTSTSGTFDGCALVSYLDLSKWDTSSVKTMKIMFQGCESLQKIEGDLANFNMGNVTNFDHFLFRCYLLEAVDCSNWDMSSAVDMSSMFYDCYSLQALEVGRWDTSSAEDMSYMFCCYSAQSNLTILDLSKWNTSNVKYMQTMFQNVSKVEIFDVSNWDTSNVEDMSWMFNKCYAMQAPDLSGWNTSKVKDFQKMFQACYAIEEIDISSFDMSSAENIDYMFNSCTNLQKIIVGDDWTISSGVVTDYYLPAKFMNEDNRSLVYNRNEPFADGAGVYIRYLDPTVFAVYSEDDNSLDFYCRYDVPEVGDVFEGKVVTNLYTGIFENSVKYTTDILWDGRRSDVTSVTVVDEGVNPRTMYAWFYNFQNCETMDLRKLDLSRCQSFQHTFAYCTNLTEILFGDNVDVSQMEYMHNMFYHCDSLESVDLSNFCTTSKLKYLKYMFAYCGKLKYVDVSGFNTVNVTDVYAMFESCKELTQIDGLENWDTSKMSNFRALFENCWSLTDLSGIRDWNTSSATDMGWMFNRLKVLDTIDLSGWDTSRVSDFGHLFNDCESLQKVICGEGWNTDSVTAETTGFLPAMFMDEDNHYQIYPTNALFFNGAGVYIRFIPTAFVIYNEEDNALYFYAKKTSVPFIGDEYDGRVVDDLWYIDEDMYYTENDVEWTLTGAHKAVVLEEGISPVSVAHWFDNMSNLEEVDILKLDTSRCEDMSYMFSDCSSLEVLDLYGITTPNVNNTEYMFENCTKLQTIYSDNSFYIETYHADMESGGFIKTNSENMFVNTPVLTGGLGTTSVDNSIDHTFAHVDGNAVYTLTPGYFTPKINVVFLNENGEEISSIPYLSGCHVTGLYKTYDAWMPKHDIGTYLVMGDGITYDKVNFDKDIVLIPVDTFSQFYGCGSSHNIMTVANEGSIKGPIEEVTVNFINNVDGEYEVYDTKKLNISGELNYDEINVLSSKVTQPIREGYVFSGWRLITVENNVYTIAAEWDVDVIGPSGGSDDIADKYQAVVTFNVVNGQWVGGGTTRSIVVNLKNEDGRLSENGSYILLESDIPVSVGNDSYEEGIWGKQPLGDVVSTGGATYTYTYGFVTPVIPPIDPDFPIIPDQPL